mgnify:FL=1
MKTICEWNNCNNLGEFKAPVEKDNSKKYRMLCLEHIKEFNKNWNYFSGMNDNQIMNFLKSDMTWHKPTQSFSSSDNFFKVLWNNTLKDEFDNKKIKSDFNYMRQFKFDNKDIKAFEILGLSVGMKWMKIHEKFKTLVKKFHPDMNLGNKKFEDKLKVITLAYTQLKKTYKNII